MPDIVSRIKVEALGADQAAREIRKLRDAYNEVGQAAKNLSPGGVGADPFAQAVSAPGGGVYGGQRAPGDIVDRESRDRNYRDQVSARESTNTNFNATTRGTPGGISQVMGTAEAVGAGQGGTALAKVATGLGALLGGPIGVALLAGGAVTLGAQKFANNAYDRMQNIWGTGISQRLGRTYTEIQDVQTKIGRKGIPFPLIEQFFQGASQTGLNMNRPGALGAAGMSLQAMTSLGIDPGTAAGLMGAMSRANLDLGRLGGDRGHRFFGQVTGFGRENVGMYLQEMARGITELATKGIDVQEAALTEQTNLLGAFKQYGGFTPEGAIALSQQTLARGVSAAQLKRPEDIIAFQAMRGEGMSITATRIAMEENPAAVNAAVYEAIKRRTGGREDIMVPRLQRWLGEGTSTSAVVKFIATMEKLGGKTPEEISAELGAGMKWMGGYFDEEGNLKFTEPEQETTAVKQTVMLRQVEKSALDLTTEAMKFVRELLTGPLDLNTVNITWKGLVLTQEEQLRASVPAGHPGLDVLSSIYSAPKIRESLIGMLRMSGVNAPELAIQDASTFGWKTGSNILMEQIARGVLADTRAAVKAGVEGVTQKPKLGELIEIMRSLLGVEVTNREQFEEVLKTFLDEAKERNYVHTDD
jgi:hypothetical protein